MVIKAVRQVVLIGIGCLGFISAFVSVLQLAEFLSSQNVPPKIEESSKPDLISTLKQHLHNVLLLCLFYVQHTGMCSQWWRSIFKDTPYACTERSIYIIATGAAMQMMMKHWTPVGREPLLVLPIQEDSGMLGTFFFLLHSVLWLLIYAGCLTMDLPEMLGIKQIYYELCELPPPLSYKCAAVQRLYRHMRHPGAICFLLILWLHPVVTVERVLFAYLATMYMWFGFTMDRQDFAYISEMANCKFAALRNHRGVDGA